MLSTDIFSSFHTVTRYPFRPSSSGVDFKLVILLRCFSLFYRLLVRQLTLLPRYVAGAERSPDHRILLP
jgi:hypothetical protein